MDNPKDMPGVSERSTILRAICVRDQVRINRFAEIVYKTNRYSVPAKLAHREAIVESLNGRIRIVVDTILVAEHEDSCGKHKAIFNLVHFIDALSFRHHGVVLAEVLRGRRFYESLQTLLNGYVETNPATASKRFMRIVALLEDHTMQAVFDAVEIAAQRGTTDPATIAVILKQRARSYVSDEDGLCVFDSAEWRNDRYNVYQEHFPLSEEL